MTTLAESRDIMIWYMSIPINKMEANLDVYLPAHVL